MFWRKIIVMAFGIVDCIPATVRQVKDRNPVMELRSGCVPDPAATS